MITMSQDAAKDKSRRTEAMSAGHGVQLCRAAMIRADHTAKLWPVQTESGHRPDK
jgi:hypothetical protein